MKVQETIEAKLTEAFDPVHLVVDNESSNHNVPVGSESHFKVVIVADCFEERRLIQRHRMVNDVLADELAGLVHALALGACSHAVVATALQTLQSYTQNVAPACFERAVPCQRDASRM